VKTIQSLLAVIQLLALGAILFGLFAVGYPYSSGESDILYRVQGDETRLAVKEWHQRTIQFSRQFTIGWGAAVFVLATGASILLAVKGSRANAMVKSARR
jgi:hypothetical protein